MSQGKKFFLSFLVIILVSSLLNTRPAYAFFPTVEQPGPLLSFFVKKEIEVGIGNALLGAFIEGATYFLNKIAYDAAVYLSTGLPNGEPLNWDKWDEYIGNVALDAGADVIGTFGDEAGFLKKYGINLCSPPDFNVQLDIKLSLFDEIGREPKLRCNFKGIAAAYANIGTPGYWRKTGVTFGSDSNELAVRNKLLGTVDIIARDQRSAQEQAKIRAEQEGQPRPVVSAINGNVTKAILEVEDISVLDSLKRTLNQQHFDNLNAGQLLAEGSILGGLRIAKTFLTTFVPRIAKLGIEKATAEIAKLAAKKELRTGGGAISNYESQGGGRREAAKLAFADLLKPVITENEPYEYLGELGQPCQEKENPSIFCGVLDAGLNQALAQAKVGAPLTVGEALEKGSLNGNWLLRDDTKDTIANQYRDCYTKAYCLTNLKKLRVFRILPIGWEAAAEISGRQRENVTLKQVVNAFNDPSSPYYHLIDPDWVLKAPLAFCKTRASGETLASLGGSLRRDVCVDFQTCLTSDAQGKCQDEQFGYCRREKNVWQFNADSCREEFNTCATLTSRQGVSVNYLTNTVDQAVCDADKVGCRAYSASQSFDVANNKWAWQTGPTASTTYLTAQAQQCNAAAEGCTEFIRLTEGVIDSKINLKKAPLYYNCYGETRAFRPTGAAGDFSSTTLAYWPANKTDLVKWQTSQIAAQQEACKRFAQVCSADEVGCEKYTPTTGNPPIPGVISIEDICPDQCVGYSTYKQLDAFFEPVPPPAPNLYFIPRTATQCSAAEVGCDEFINIGAAAVGGEQKEYYKELRYCSATESDGAVYFTWEGSDTAGYQLKSHFLLPGNPWDNSEAGRPPTYQRRLASDPNGIFTSADIQNFQNECKKDLYQDPDWRSEHPDCREFYDKDGNISYRLYSKTISVSATECQNLRKTVSTQSVCASTGGQWQSAGQFCTYNLIKSQSISCPATASGCRAYKGNTGNNLQLFLSETFERVATTTTNVVGGRSFDNGKTVWLGGEISNEATVVGGHSLTKRRSPFQMALQFATPSVKAQYVVSFWAKGQARDLKTRLFRGQQALPLPALPTPLPIPPPVDLVGNIDNLSNDWHVYEAGPFEINWLPTAPAPDNIATTTLSWESAGGQFFIDNVVIRRITDNVYVVKNSWRTPAFCDTAEGIPNGTPLPQGQLGCAEYRRRDNKPVYLKSFTNLCREEAIGCERMTDTFNRGSETPPEDANKEKVFNAVCSLAIPTGPGSSVFVKNNTNQGQPCYYDASDTTKFCTVPVNEGSCLFNYIGTRPTPPVLSLPQFPRLYLITETEAIKISPQRPVYLVNDQKFACQNEALGCSALGLRGYKSAGPLGVAVGGGPHSPITPTTTTVYLKNLPTEYDRILCAEQFEGCEAYTNTKGGNLYFKDPKIFGNALCEYKESVSIRVPPGVDQTFRGWFRKDVGYCAAPGLNIITAALSAITQCQSDNDCATGVKCARPLPCYPGFLQGNTFGIWRVGDTQYQTAPQKMVGLCSAEQNGCSEFVDVTDTSELPRGKPYFLFDNEKIVRGGGSDCNGQVSFKKGCVLFNETSRRGLLWHATSTYSRSENLDNQLVAPINCEQTPRPPECLAGIKNNANVILKVIRDRVCGEWLACRTSSKDYDSRDNQLKTYCSELVACQKGGAETANCVKFQPVVGQAATVPLDKQAYQARNVTWAGQDYSGYSVLGQPPIETISVSTSSPLYRCRAYPEDSSPYNIDKNDRGKWPDINICAPGEKCDCSYTQASFGPSEKTFYFGKDTIIEQKSVTPGGALAIGVCDGPKAGILCAAKTDCGEGGDCLAHNKIKDKIADGLRGYCLEEDSTIPLPSSKDVPVPPQPCFNWLPLDRSSAEEAGERNIAAGGELFQIRESLNYCLSADSVFKTARARPLCVLANTRVALNRDFPGWDSDSLIRMAACAYKVDDPDPLAGGVSRGCGSDYWTIVGKDTNRCPNTAPRYGNVAIVSCPISCVKKDAKNRAYSFSTPQKADNDDETLIKNNLSGITETNFYDCDTVLKKLYELAKKGPYRQALEDGSGTSNFIIPTLIDEFPQPTLSDSTDAWDNFFTRNCRVGPTDTFTLANFGSIPVNGPTDYATGLYYETGFRQLLESELACQNILTVNKPGSVDKIKGYTDRLWASRSPTPFAIIDNWINNNQIKYQTPPTPFGRFAAFDVLRPSNRAVPVTSCVYPQGLNITDSNFSCGNVSHTGLSNPKKNEGSGLYYDQGLRKLSYFYTLTGEKLNPNDPNSPNGLFLKPPGNAICYDIAGVQFMRIALDGQSQTHNPLNGFLPAMVLAEAKLDLVCPPCSTLECFKNCDDIPLGEVDLRPLGGSLINLRERCYNLVGGRGAVATEPINYNILTTAKNRLDQLFAKYYLYYYWGGQDPLNVAPPSPGKYSSVQLPVTTNYALWEMSNDKGVPPTIVPVGSNGEEAWANSAADFQGGITVSARNQSVNSYNTTRTISIPDHLGYVTVEFYAFAAKNQLPIRRVLVDWDDGRYSGNTLISPDNAFLNRRANCGVNETEFPEASPLNALVSGVPLGRLVDTNIQGFGGQENVTCFEKAPFIFTHFYFCYEGEPNWNNGQCEFKPKVQVLDNWGWCNAHDQPNGGRWQGDFAKAMSDNEAESCSLKNINSWTRRNITIRLTPPP